MRSTRIIQEKGRTFVTLGKHRPLLIPNNNACRPFSSQTLTANIANDIPSKISTTISPTTIRRSCYSTSPQLLKSTSQQQQSDIDHCIELVQSRDREGYMIGLLQPSAQRHDYFILRAFNAELASIKGSSLSKSKDGDVSLGTQMRMQWWRDAIGNLYEGKEEDNYDNNNSTMSGGSGSSSSSRSPLLESAKHNPIIRALSTLIDTHVLTQRFLERLVDARMEDLHVSQFNTIQELSTYSERTISSLYYLQLEATGVREESSDIVASHIGIGVGLTNALRSLLPRAGIHGEIALPRDVVIHHLVNIQLLKHPPPELQDLDSPTNAAAREGIRNAVKEVAQVAQGHFRQARQGQIQVPKQARGVLLPAVPAMDYLNLLEKVEYDIFHPDLNSEDSFQGNWAKLRGIFLLGRAAMTGIF